MPTTDLSALHDAILALESTGSLGFEGFVRDAFAEITGQAFRLMKSGPQGGVDVIGDLGGNAFTIGLEGKQYRQSTRLPLDQLKAKLDDAAETFPDLDLWVLATTREISGGDAREMQKRGEGKGLDVLVLDWSQDGGELPLLAVLASSAPNSAAQHLPSVSAALAAIRATPVFAASQTRLVERLTRADVGYSAACRIVNEWNRDQMRDKTVARNAFDSFANLEDPDGYRIERLGVSEALNAWWQNEQNAPVALLGDEGRGKTWAAFSWWLSRADHDFPLTLIAAARDVDSSDAIGCAAKALLRATRIRSIDFWRRRLARWASAKVTASRLLLIVDGLNQKWEFRDWSNLVQTLQVEWNGGARVLLTCRPDHWRVSLLSLIDISPAPLEITVPVFDDDELDRLLSAYGLQRTDFSDEMVLLLRVPRLCHLAIHRRAALQQSGDITRERLIYEDWRSRLFERGNRLALSDDEFRKFVASLGQDATANQGGVSPTSLSRAEILDRLGADSGRNRNDLEGALSEIIDGGWLAPMGDPHRFRLRPEMLAPAMGLLLVQQVAGSETLGEAEETLASFLEPLEAQDLAVAILRAASSFALIDSRVPSAMRRALLRRWFGAQNFSSTDFEAFWRLIGCDVESVLDAVDEEWSNPSNGARADEVIVKGFANAIRWPEVSRALEPRLAEWLSGYWDDGRRGAIIGRPHDDADAAKRRTETNERAIDWMTFADTVAPDIKIEFQDNDTAWRSHRAIELMSWLPRAPYVRALKAWAISRTIMRHSGQDDWLAWLLRWNVEDHDETETAVIAAASQLMATGHALPVEAGTKLLTALATPTAYELLKSASQIGKPKSFNWFPETVSIGPDGLLLWDRSIVADWPRCEGAPLERTIGLAAFANDPQAQLQDIDANHLVELAQAVTDAQARSSLRDVAQTHGGRDTGELPLCRWAPEARAELARRRFAAASELVAWESSQQTHHARLWHRLRTFFRRPLVPPPIDRERVLSLAGTIPSSLVLLDDAALTSWRQLAELDRKTAPKNEALNDALQGFALVNLSASQQIELLQQMPEGPVITAQFKKLLATPELPDFASLAELMVRPRNISWLYGWLDYLLIVDIKNMPTAWATLHALLTHTDSKVRAAAMQIVWRSRDQNLIDAFESTNWFAADGMDRIECAYGSLLLSRSSDAKILNSGVAARAHPQVLGEFATQRPEIEEYLKQFAAYVSDQVDSLHKSGSRTFPKYPLSNVAGWDLLAERCPILIRRLVEPYLDGSTLFSPHLFLESFPLLQLISAYKEVDNAGAGHLLTLAIGTQVKSNFGVGSLTDLAICFEGNAGDAGRNLLLDAACDDAKLADLAIGAQRHGQTRWLHAAIDRDLAERSAGKIARGITLAGFLDDTDDALERWDAELTAFPAEGWLNEIRSASRFRFETNRRARHWYRTFLAAPTNAEIAGAFELFLSCADDRFFSDDFRPTTQQVNSWSTTRQIHWQLNGKRLLAAIEERKKNLKSVFLFEKPGGRSQSPFMK